MVLSCSKKRGAWAKPPAFFLDINIYSLKTMSNQYQLYLLQWMDLHLTVIKVRMRHAYSL